MKRRPSRSRQARKKRHASQLSHLSEEQLLDTRISDLDLSIEKTEIQGRIESVLSELDEKGISFRPHFWLSDDWFTPDGIPGVAIPFYLAHPRLAKLELSQMLEVEGGTPESCLRILRHEVGHAIDNAYRLRRKRKRQHVFGKSTEPYPEHYLPRPYSRSYVVHLEFWYAQSHPDEDFAETFAVWLNPASEWRQRYAGWPALKKLELMDELMSHYVIGRRPMVRTRREIDPLKQLRMTLRRYYEKKRDRYDVEYPKFFDRDLRRLFSDSPAHKDNMTAATYLMRIRKEVRRTVARWTGAYQYTIDQVLKEMIIRCRRLNLRLTKPEQETQFEFTVLLTVHTMNHLHTGGNRVSL